MQIFRRKSIDNNIFSRNSSKIPRKFLARSDFYLYLCHRYNLLMRTLRIIMWRSK